MQRLANALAGFTCLGCPKTFLPGWCVLYLSRPVGEVRVDTVHWAKLFFFFFFSKKCPYRNTSINISVFVFLTVVHAATLSAMATTTEQQQPQATLKTNSSSVQLFF